jgi:hypothetical protein
MFTAILLSDIRTDFSAWQAPDIGLPLNVARSRESPLQRLISDVPKEKGRSKLRPFHCAPWRANQTP